MSKILSYVREKIPFLKSESDGPWPIIKRLFKDSGRKHAGGQPRHLSEVIRQVPLLVRVGHPPRREPLDWGAGRHVVRLGGRRPS